jgi:hypothetical protein
MTSELSYLPSDLEEARSTIAVQLPGLELDRDGCFIDGIHVTRLSYSDWRLLENSGVAQELMADYSRRARYFCVFAFPFELEAAHYRMVMWQVEQLFMALWLHKDGTLIDHHYTTKYMRCGSKRGEITGSVKQNTPGIYGSELLVGRLTPSYELNQSEIPAIEASVRLLRTYRTFRSNPAVDVALGNFRWLQGPSLVTRERLTLLFTALESLFGGFRERYGDATLGTRAEVLLPTVSGGGRTRNFIDKKLHELRNILAHGGVAPPHAPVADALSKLTAVVRSGVHAALRFSVVFPDIEDTVRQLVGDIQPWSAREAFNHVLGLTATGSDEAARLLDAQPQFHDPIGALFRRNRVAAERNQT